MSHKRFLPNCEFLIVPKRADLALFRKAKIKAFFSSYP